MGAALNASDKMRREALAVVREIGMILPVARAFRVSDRTIKKWVDAAGIRLPSARKRMAMGARLRTGSRQQHWDKVLALHHEGKTHREIADVFGFASESTITHILRSREKTI